MERNDCDIDASFGKNETVDLEKIVKELNDNYKNSAIYIKIEYTAYIVSYYKHETLSIRTCT